MTNVDARLDEIERRLARLERLAFLTFQDVRDVGSYAYENFRLDVEPEEVRQLPARFNQLSDQEALATGLALHELASLKATMRILRHQVRRDALGIVRDLMRRGRKEQMRFEETA